MLGSFIMVVSRHAGRFTLSLSIVHAWIIYHVMHAGRCALFRAYAHALMFVRGMLDAVLLLSICACNRTWLRGMLDALLFFEYSACLDCLSHDACWTMCFFFERIRMLFCWSMISAIVSLGWQFGIIHIISLWVAVRYFSVASVSCFNVSLKIDSPVDV